MSPADEIEQLRADNRALQQQVRQLLEQLVGSYPQQTPAAQATQAAPAPEPQPTPPPAPQPRPAPAAAQATTIAQDERPDRLQLLLNHIYTENGRLIDIVRSQAEELGALRERSRSLEAARERHAAVRDRQAAALQTLVATLQEAP
jgi:hypothetical protein